MSIDGDRRLAFIPLLVSLIDGNIKTALKIAGMEVASSLISTAMNLHLDIWMNVALKTRTPKRKKRTLNI